MGERLDRLSWLLAREVDLQATLLHGRTDLRLELGRVRVVELLDEVERAYRAHPAARGRSLVVALLVASGLLTTSRTGGSRSR